eukprot:gnl/Dysnectes_brevis/710_a783_6146.p1 GENE.gnl/Dysnectes_brevis/710_a783_6146~~gnl/Dysnectes_brevis/710_a783_6146.p1  ORF type:complete len:215 (+),score=40.34 gnl/Dysnectes_brevis/710_a783_6146:43-645(+)
MEKVDRLCQHVKREAQEKVSEIESKAEQNAHLARLHIINTETSRLKKEFAKRERLMVQQKRITQSSSTNSSRLELLKARSQQIDTVKQKVLGELAESTDSTIYKDQLRAMIVQCLQQMSDGKILSVTEKDQEMGKELSQEFDMELGEALPPTAIGGCVVFSPDTKISVNNTLAKRAEQAFRTRLPELRVTMFESEINIQN